MWPTIGWPNKSSVVVQFVWTLASLIRVNLAASIDEWRLILSSFVWREKLNVHGMHGGSAVWFCGIGYQEDGGTIDGVEQRCIDGLWRKEWRRRKRREEGLWRKPRDRRQEGRRGGDSGRSGQWGRRVGAE